MLPSVRNKQTIGILRGLKMPRRDSEPTISMDMAPSDVLGDGEEQEQQTGMPEAPRRKRRTPPATY